MGYGHLLLLSNETAKAYQIEKNRMGVMIFREAKVP
jgi:hypothetical protein